MVRILDSLRASSSFTNVFHDNYESNARAFSSHLPTIRKAGGYIEDQAHYKDMRLGRASMAFAGCEIIAVYNALHDLNEGHPTPLPDLIRDFEKKGMILSGLFGTSPRSIRDYFKTSGYRVDLATAADAFGRIDQAHDCLIMTFYNDAGDIRAQIHTTAITKKSGVYTIHNYYGNGAHPVSFTSLSSLLDRMSRFNVKPICLIGISR